MPRGGLRGETCGREGRWELGGDVLEGWGSGGVTYSSNEENDELGVQQHTVPRLSTARCSKSFIHRRLFSAANLLTRPVTASVFRLKRASK